MTKLIFVEGLPGAGKSTTAKAIYDLIKNKGIDAEIIYENDNHHPIDFDGVAFFNSVEFSELKKNYISLEPILDKIKIKEQNGYLIPFRKAIDEGILPFENSLMSELARKDVYELSLVIHMELIENRWKNFVSSHIKSDKVYIFECCLIQNPVTVTMIRNGATKEITKNYINRLAKMIEPLDPILIYIVQDNIEFSFIKAIQDRPKEWYEGFEEYYTGHGYGLKNNLNGIDGIIQILEERNKVETEIFESIKFDKYKLDNTLFDTSDLKNQIGNIIDCK